MTVYVFTGPTLPPSVLAAEADVVCLPPVAQGDVYRVVGLRPRAIGIIDGYFEGMAAVCHKEILWAMSEGVHVFGSASMGALRAAELHAFGMRGVGRIFAAYRDGELEDDDEVAVLHGPAESGFVNLSEPLVNIRATLERAVGEKVIPASAREVLIAHAKRLFYQDRAWDRLLAGAAGDLPAEVVAALQSWLPAGRLDQKRADARAMLAAMREFLAADPGPQRVTYDFEWTDAWDAVAAGGRRVESAAAGAAALDEAQLLAELRLDEGLFEAVRERALLRFLAAGDAAGRRFDVEAAARQAAATRLRTCLGLFQRADLDRWCAENGLDARALERLLDDEARIDAGRAWATPRLGHRLLDQLRVDGHYARLAVRARHKRDVLDRQGHVDPVPDDTGLTPLQLLAWHFESRLGRSIPDDIDAHLRDRGYADRQDFYRALTREWLYCRSGQVGVHR
jgi:hypothetical protein